MGPILPICVFFAGSKHTIIINDIETSSTFQRVRIQMSTPTQTLPLFLLRLQSLIKFRTNPPAQRMKRNQKLNLLRKNPTRNQPNPLNLFRTKKTRNQKLRRKKTMTRQLKTIPIPKELRAKKCNL